MQLLNWINIFYPLPLVLIIRRLLYLVIVNFRMLEARFSRGFEISFSREKVTFVYLERSTTDLPDGWLNVLLLSLRLHGYHPPLRRRISMMRVLNIS